MSISNPPQSISETKDFIVAEPFVIVLSAYPIALPIKAIALLAESIAFGEELIV